MIELWMTELWMTEEFRMMSTFDVADVDVL